jgi:DNA-directed RNA polymerase specialized sigma24 family protein
MPENKNQTAKGSAGTKTARTNEEVFQALPPLGSDAYIEHISKATTRELPPEVLARALRQLPPKSCGYEATLERLLRRKGKGWDYFGPLVAQARRMVVGTHDHDDVLQDAFTRILQVLPTTRGELSERAWRAFCRREANDAWRARFGRRKERLPKEQAIEAGESVDNGEDESSEDIFDVANLPPWHVKICEGDSQKIEQMALKVLEEIPDDFVREVASRAWFQNKRPKISGATKADAAPLTTLFPGKSRHQIQRALRHADSQLAAALLANEEIDCTKDAQAFLELRRDGVQTSAVRREEKR